MSRWFRLDDDVVNDPKVQRLPGDKFKLWINTLCVASKYNGVLPAVSELAFILRLTPEKTSALLDEFCSAGLIDQIGVEKDLIVYQPHNWNERQYRSDTADPTAAERNRRYRNRKRNDPSADRNGDRNAGVTLTPTRTESRIRVRAEYSGS